MAKKKKKVINYWCPDCQKLLKYYTESDVVPSAMKCLYCQSQVWWRGEEEKKGDTKQ